MSCFKCVIGDTLSSRDEGRPVTEVAIVVKSLD
jgi:hypothetical protein